MTTQVLKYQSQSVSRLYFIAAMVLFAGQIIFGVALLLGHFWQAQRQIDAPNAPAWAQ